MMAAEKLGPVVAYCGTKKPLGTINYEQSKKNGNKSVHLLWYIPGDVVELMPAMVLKSASWVSSAFLA